MADFTRVVEFLRDIRQGPLQSVTEEMTQLAADYAQLCTQANERLRQCSAFLQQGLRTEAIHLADEQPNLLDLVAALDLPDQQAWAEFCQNNALAVPPPLQLERAAQLNEAYAQDQPLEHLLAHHRLLALSRAPIRERLNTLRKIAEVDAAGTAAWEKDIRMFEVARLKELPAALHTAVKSRDNAALSGLMDEVIGHTWYEAVPADLISSVTDLKQRMMRAGVEAQLRKLVEPLRDAYAARSLQECQALVQRWKNVLTTGGVTQVAPELNDEIKPVVAFINEQTKRDEFHKRFRESCKAFGRMLDEDAGDAQLEAGYAKLKEFKGEEIPEDLARRYLEKKTGRRQTVERTHKMRLVTIGSVAVGAIVIVLVVVYLMMNSNKAQQAADRIDGFVNLHTRAGMDSAGQYVEGLSKSNPGLLKEPNVAAAVSRLQSEQGDFSQAKTTLQGILKKAEAARVAAGPVIGNAAAPIAEIARAAEGLQKALNDANTAPDLAWVDTENTLAAAQANLKTSLAALRDRTNSAARTELEKIGRDLDTVPVTTTNPEAAAAAQVQIAALRDRLAAVRGMPQLDDAVSGALATLTQKVDQRFAGAGASRTVAEGLQNVKLHSDSAADLQGALENFVARFPGDARTAGFKQALARLPMAVSLDAWQQLVGPWVKSPAAGNAAAAQKRLDALTAFLAANPGMPMAAAAGNYSEYLKHAIDAQSDKGVWQTAFNDVLANPLMAELATMNVSDGRQIYTLGEVKRTERSINKQVSVTFEALDLKDPLKRVTVTIEPPATVSMQPTPAPHTKVVAELTESLKMINESNWDTFGIDALEKLSNNTAMDPIVKAILVLTAMKAEETATAWGTAAPLEGVYTKAIAELTRQNPANLAWWDPAKIGEPTRNSIRGILQGLPPANVARQKVVNAREAFGKTLELPATGTGVLLKDDAGAWAVYTHAVVLPGATVWTVAPGGGTEGSLVKVGAFGDGKYVMDEATLRGVPEGSLVYLVRP